MRSKIVAPAYLICFFLSFPLFAADSLEYVPPVDHTIRLTGNFMEIRSNHFHAGIDIRSSKGRTGDIIRAIFDGYVSRIKISSGGYGNALYIDHPQTGHTSVYAHLENFIPEIEEYIRNIQYSCEQFEVDIYLPPGILEISRSQQIGTMGNTGHSFGPHLHFEIRDRRTEHPLNPEDFGFAVPDNKAPVMQSLFVYEMDSSFHIVERNRKFFHPGPAGYGFYKNTVQTNAPYLGLGVQIYDLTNDSGNRNGIYGYSLFVKDSLVFTWEADRFSFDETRAINGFIDFHKRKTTGEKIYLLFKMPCNLFSGFDHGSSGMLKPDSLALPVRIECYDFMGNTSVSEFNIEKSNSSDYSSEVIACDSLNVMRTKNFTVVMGPYSLFRPVQLNVEEFQKQIDNTVYPGIKIGSESIAVNGYYEIEVPAGIINDDGKWTLAYQDSRGRIGHFGLSKSGDKYVAQVDQLGDFFLYRDETAPRITVISLDPKMRSAWKFRIDDNIYADGKLPDLTYNARVNGAWIRLKFDLKSRMLIFEDFDKLPQGESFFLEIIVTDHCKNEARFTRHLES